MIYAWAGYLEMEENTTEQSIMQYATPLQKAKFSATKTSFSSEKDCGTWDPFRKQAFIKYMNHWGKDPETINYYFKNSEVMVK